jgi:hypothetical protein
MEISPLAGKPASRNLLVDLARLEREYYERQPGIGDPDQLSSFETFIQSQDGVTPMAVISHAILGQTAQRRAGPW